MQASESSSARASSSRNEVYPGSRLASYQHETVLATDLDRLPTSSRESTTVSADYPAPSHNETIQTSDLGRLASLSLAAETSSPVEPDDNTAHPGFPAVTPVRTRAKRRHKTSTTTTPEKKSSRTTANPVNNDVEDDDIDGDGDKDDDDDDDDDEFEKQRWAYIISRYDDAKKAKNALEAEAASAAALDFLKPSNPRYAGWQYNLALHQYYQKKYSESLTTLKAIQLGKDKASEHYGGKVSDLMAAVYHFMNENKTAEVHCKRALKIFRKPGVDERHLVGSMLLLIRILDRQGKIIERDFYKTLLPKRTEPEIKK